MFDEKGIKKCSSLSSVAAVSICYNLTPTLCSLTFNICLMLVYDSLSNIFQL